MRSSRLLVSMLLGASPAFAQEELHRWEPEVSLNLLGDALDGVGDLDGDGHDDVVITDRLDDTVGVNAGRARVFSGRTGLELFRFHGLAAGDNFGLSAAGAGDVDADGVPDIVISARRDNGYVQVFSGADGQLLHHFQNRVYRDGFGSCVDGAGDVDADGHADVLVGAFDDDRPRDNAGRVYVFSGRTGTPIWQIWGAFIDAELSACCGLGDLDGDGHDDFAIGAARGGQSDRTDAYVQVYSGADKALMYEFPSDPGNSDFFGSEVRPAGDVNGDGVPDIAVAAPHGNNGAGSRSGAAYVYSGASGNLLLQLDGTRRDQEFGCSIEGVGDLTGDGRGELLVGSWASSEVHLVDGRDGRLLHHFPGRYFDDHFGDVVRAAGDLNRDGIQDFLVGAPETTVFGPLAGTAVAYSGNDLWINASARDLSAGDPLHLEVLGGPSDGFLALYAVEMNGLPRFLLVLVTVLDHRGRWELDTTVPPGLAGLSLSLRAYARRESGVSDSARLPLEFH